MFALQCGKKSFQAKGVRRRLPAGSVETLEARTRAFFGTHSDDPSPDVLVGAIPFDTKRDDLLFQPEHILRDNAPGPAPASAAGNGTQRNWVPLRVVGEPDSAGYLDMVVQALARIAEADNHGLRKVVLARRLHIDASAPVDPLMIVQRLSQDTSATTFLVNLSDSLGDEGHMLVGATPELLVSRQGMQVLSHPLAGSAPRSRDTTDDRQAGEALMQSDKDRREHALVVESILDLLSPLCVDLSTPHGTGLRSTAAMWHLGTHIEGTLKPDGPSAAGLAAILHPTPAVGGHPRQAALDAIRALEGQDRGFYAGAVGWTDARGDGEWHVALRCAELCGARLTLHAGAGIVAGSDPAAELAEISAKFQTMLRALGLGDESIALKDWAA